MKIGFFISTTENYEYLGTTLLKSILVNNPKFTYDFNVIVNKNFSIKNRENMLNIYPVIFREYDPEIYVKYNKMKPQYRSIEMFQYDEYDRIIFTGADVLCVNSINDMVERAKSIKCIGMGKEKRRADMFSNGTMLINKSCLGKKTYMQLLKADYKHIKMFGTDMKLYNCFFKGRIEQIEYKYNSLNSEIIKYEELKNMIFYHYVHKPLATKQRIPMWIYNIWMKYYRYDPFDIKRNKYKKEFT